MVLALEHFIVPGVIVPFIQVAAEIAPAVTVLGLAMAATGLAQLAA